MTCYYPFFTCVSDELLNKSITTVGNRPMENSPELSLAAMELSLSQEQVKLYMYCYQHEYTFEGDESFAAWKALKDQVIPSQLCTDTAITVSIIDVPEIGLA